jgi:NAD(P)-dependent dehydrogenase (short-subunit alcohol dehydrogenase family)
MARMNVVTGAASGIGKATTELLRARGEKVITADLRDCDINADLTTAEGREFYASEVARLSEGKLDAVYAIAGLSAPIPATVAVNYFGAIASVESVRELLLTSDAPRVVITSSIASYMGHDEELLELQIAGDEPASLARAAELAKDPAIAPAIYGTSKRAVTRWIRANAVKPEWAGAGIALNGVGPGVIRTPMTEEMLADPDVAAGLEQTCPAPFHGPAADPMWIAQALAFLGSPDNMFITGQVLFADGGAEASIRPELV